MRNIVQNYNPKLNFWEENPQFQAANPFNKLYKSDKSKNKKDSSDIMWSIALIYHPKSDLYYIDNKEETVLHGNADKFIEKNKEYIDCFIDAALTQAEKSLISWEKRMKQRDEFLSEQKYTFGYTIDTEEGEIEYKDNTKAFDDMQSKTAKFYEEFFKIKKELFEEESVSKNKKEKSATSSGEI